MYKKTDCELYELFLTDPIAVIHLHLGIDWLSYLDSHIVRCKVCLDKSTEEALVNVSDILNRVTEKMLADFETKTYFVCGVLGICENMYLAYVRMMDENEILENKERLVGIERISNEINFITVVTLQVQKTYPSQRDRIKELMQKMECGDFVGIFLVRADDLDLPKNGDTYHDAVPDSWELVTDYELNIGDRSIASYISEIGWSRIPGLKKNEE